MTRKKPTTSQAQISLLSEQLNLNHSLVKLAEAIDWENLEAQFGQVMTAKGGRRALPSRLMVGLHYLKALYGESDESVVAKWIENPYWQYFCGETIFQHELPCHPTSLVKWRNRVGVAGIEELLKQVVQTAIKVKALKPKDLKRLNVDTTVQEKAIAFPTDARLYDKARRALVRVARKLSIQLRQSFARLGKKALFKQSRYRVARQNKRAQKQTKKLRTYLGRVIRDLERKMPFPPEALQRLLSRAKRIHQQKRSDSNKLYSVHAPEVSCIAKGKAHQRYEFGCKVVLVSTNRSNWIVGIKAMTGNPYDGATLIPALEQVEQLSQIKAEQVFVDKGFRGKAYHPNEVNVCVAGTRQFSDAERRGLKRRSAIEPIIGHTKQEHRLQRNYLRGQIGDQMNAMLAGCGFNLRKLLHFFDSSSSSVPV